MTLFPFSEDLVTALGHISHEICVMSAVSCVRGLGMMLHRRTTISPSEMCCSDMPEDKPISSRQRFKNSHTPSSMEPVICIDHGLFTTHLGILVYGSVRCYSPAPDVV